MEFALREKPAAKSPVVISPFRGTQKDMETIAELHLEIRQWQEAIGQNSFTNILDSQEDLTNIIGYYIASGGNFFVAYDRETGNVVGFVGLKREADGTGVGKRLAVKPEYQRQGVATELLDYLRTWAVENGFEKFTHRTNEGEKAFALYEKHGFTIIGYDESNGDYVMEMALASE
jgi:ribosomal protein S18 acetylase RimI-like enzyme